MQLQSVPTAAVCPEGPWGFFMPHLLEPRDRQRIPVPVVLSRGALISRQGAKRELRLLPFPSFPKNQPGFSPAAQNSGGGGAMP